MIEAATHTLSPRDQEVRGHVIRVAHVAGYSEASSSGVDRTVVGLVTHLERYGVVPEVWHLSPRYASVTDRRAGLVRVIELPAHHRARSALFGLPEASLRFISERRDAVDVLHLHSVFIPDNVWVARLARRPYVITPHGGYSPEVLAGHNRVAKRLWMKMRERDYVRGASLVHAVSPRELDQLHARFDAPPLVFVPNAIDLPASRVAAQDRMLGERKRIVFLGRLAVDHKGLDLLLEGYARYVRGRRDADTELIIAGPDFRSGRTELEALAASLLPGMKVQFTGALFGSDKEALLRSAYVFVHTSRWEGMPYAVLEALATGCPVLLTSATNLGEFVEDFGAGVVVKGTAQGVAEGLGRLLEMPTERYGAMCSAARRLASERFTWPTVAEQLTAAYRSIVG